MVAPTRGVRDMIKAGVVGWPIAQSKSPIIHGHWLDKYGISGSYERIAIEPGNFEQDITGLINAGFSLSYGQSVNIQIVDIHGKVIRTLREQEYFGIGEHIVHFNADKLTPGIYFFNINGKNFSLSEKFIKS